MTSLMGTKAPLACGSCFQAMALAVGEAVPVGVVPGSPNVAATPGSFGGCRVAGATRAPTIRPAPRTSRRAPRPAPAQRTFLLIPLLCLVVPQHQAEACGG